MPTPSLSLIVPLYNEAGTAALLEHLHALDGFDQIILVDASDNPRCQQNWHAVAAAYAHRAAFEFITSSVKGRAAQMNLGAARARGDALVFLHCDTRLPPDAAQLLRACLNAGYIWGRFDLRLDSGRAALRLIQSMINLRSRVRRLATGDQAMFIRRARFIEVGGFADIALMEDIELSRRLKRDRPALITTPVVSAARRWQQHGIVKTVLLMWALRMAFWLGVNPTRLAAWYADVR